MKNLPNRSMDEIWNEFHTKCGGPSIELIRNEGGGTLGGMKQEIAWAVAKGSILMHKEGWTYIAIGRFFHRNHSTIMYHCKG